MRTNSTRTSQPFWAYFIDFNPCQGYYHLNKWSTLRIKDKIFLPMFEGNLKKNEVTRT